MSERRASSSSSPSATFRSRPSSHNSSSSSSSRAFVAPQSVISKNDRSEEEDSDSYLRRQSSAALESCMDGIAMTTSDEREKGAKADGGGSGGGGQFLKTKKGATKAKKAEVEMRPLPVGGSGDDDNDGVDVAQDWESSSSLSNDERFASARMASSSAAAADDEAARRDFNARRGGGINDDDGDDVGRVKDGSLRRTLNSRTQLLEGHGDDCDGGGEGEGAGRRRRHRRMRSYDTDTDTDNVNAGGSEDMNSSAFLVPVNFDGRRGRGGEDRGGGGSSGGGGGEKSGGGGGGGVQGGGILRRISYRPDSAATSDASYDPRGDQDEDEDDEDDTRHNEEEESDDSEPEEEEEGYLSDPFLHAVDFLEDEIDGHAYDDLVPLSVRLAIEEQMFGWDNFFADIAGHILYTSFWAGVAWWLVTWIGLERIKEGETVRPSFFRNRSEQYYEPRFGLSFHTFVLIRFFVALSTAISSFRTIRRRKKVWFRHAYGSAEYKNDLARRRQSVEETDRLSILGKIRRGAGTVGSAVSAANAARKARKVRKKLRKAEMRFERRHRHGRYPGMIRNLLSRRGGGMGGSAAVDSDAHHERVKMLSMGGGGGGRSTPGGSSVGSSSAKVRRRRRKLSGGRRASRDDDQRSGVMYHSGLSPPSHADDDNDTAPTYDDDYDDMDDSDSKGRHIDDTFHTPRDARWSITAPLSPPGANRVGSSTPRGMGIPQSILRDQLPLPSGPIHSVPYAHGGFFGAAPFMLADPLWVDVLRSLMPDVYVEISRRALSAAVPKLIHWAENNPVVAAYGTAHEMERSGRLTAVEWDVFLDPGLVRRVEIVLEERDRFLAKLRRNVPTTWAELHLADGDVYAHSSHVEALPPMASESDAAVLRYYNREIRKRTSVLVDRMLIAHGNLTQLVLEQTGVAKYYNFSRIKRSRKTLGGGIFARQWLAAYAEALKMGMGWDESYPYGGGVHGGGWGEGGSASATSVSATSSFDEEGESGSASASASSSYPSSSVPTTPAGSDTESEEEEEGEEEEKEDVPLLSSPARSGGGGRGRGRGAREEGDVEMTASLWRRGDGAAAEYSTPDRGAQQRRQSGQQSSGCGSFEPRKKGALRSPSAGGTMASSPISPTGSFGGDSISSGNGNGGPLSRGAGAAGAPCVLLDDDVPDMGEMIIIDGADNVRSSTQTFKSSGNSRRRKRGGCYRTRDFHFCDGTCHRMAEVDEGREEDSGATAGAAAAAAAAGAGRTGGGRSSGGEGWKAPPLPAEWLAQTSPGGSRDGTSGSEGGNRKGRGKGRGSVGGGTATPSHQRKKKSSPPSTQKPARRRRVVSVKGHHRAPHTSLSALALSSTPNTSIAQSIDMLRTITDCRAPLGLVLDVKSRHVSHRIWALVVDALRDAGARVEGIASFTWDEIRDVSRYCASPVREIYFFHSAGDLQKACHEGHVRDGDCVFFNAGSLLWDRLDWSDPSEVWETMRRRFWDRFDAADAKARYGLMPYARIRAESKPDGAEENDDDDDDKSTGTASSSPSRSPMLPSVPPRCSTIQDYKERYNLSIGLYCQEFAVDDAAVDFFVRHVNDNPGMYDLGLSWGGVNGITVRGIQPGRFTHTDGFWNQRYAGESWDGTLFPPERLEEEEEGEDEREADVVVGNRRRLPVRGLNHAGEEF